MGNVDLFLVTKTLSWKKKACCKDSDCMKHLVCCLLIRSRMHMNFNTTRVLNNADQRFKCSSVDGMHWWLANIWFCRPSHDSKILMLTFMFILLCVTELVCGIRADFIQFLLGAPAALREINKKPFGTQQKWQTSYSCHLNWWSRSDHKLILCVLPCAL